MATVSSIITGALVNFKPDSSVWAGGGAAVLTVALGAVLVAAGVVIPPIAILGLHIGAIPLTMQMFTAAAIPIGHIVTSYVSPTLNQQINGLAKTLGADADKIRALIPQVQYTYPRESAGTFNNMPPAQGQSNSNINKG